jgi:hypothetical protein
MSATLTKEIQMSAAKKIEQMVQANVNTQEAMISEYLKLKSEQSVLEASARKAKDDADILKAAIEPFLKVKGVAERIGRFEVISNERSREGVSIKDARKSLSPAARAEFETLVTESSWTELKVKVLDQVGDLMDAVEDSQS